MFVWLDDCPGGPSAPLNISPFVFSDRIPNLVLYFSDYAGKNAAVLKKKEEEEEEKTNLKEAKEAGFDFALFSGTADYVA